MHYLSNKSSLYSSPGEVFKRNIFILYINIYTYTHICVYTYRCNDRCRERECVCVCVRACAHISMHWICQNKYNHISGTRGDSHTHAHCWTSTLVRTFVPSCLTLNIPTNLLTLPQNVLTLYFGTESVGSRTHKGTGLLFVWNADIIRLCSFLWKDTSLSTLVLFDQMEIRNRVLYPGNKLVARWQIQRSWDHRVRATIPH